jgi:stearoyl-CoA desaturase (delta-9 desaturase)
MRYALGILAQCGAYGSLLYWCADHRRHHSATDKPGDPHSPYFDGHGRSLSKWKGIAHAHYAWIFDDTITDLSIFGKGTNDDPAILFAHRTRHFWFAFSTVLLPAFWGWAFGGTAAILSTVMVAGFLRMMVGMHAIVLVNSIGHVNGYQRFKSPHSAKNNWFIALITLGEGWHSNHHTYPNAASTSMAWYEIDITGLLISLLEKIGLVWNVRRLPPAHIRKTQISQTS